VQAVVAELTAFMGRQGKRPHVVVNLGIEAAPSVAA
jgi:hypothetical protein